MAYRANPNSGPRRDKTYPSEIAAERPALATRIHCYEDPEIDETIRGDEADGRVAKFNRQLRGGHAGRNDGDE